MNEYRNMTARCVDRNSDEDFVLHEVSYERKEQDGTWKSHVVRIIASDPMSAIKIVRTN
jgi:hypothetical protein